MPTRTSPTMMPPLGVDGPRETPRSAVTARAPLFGGDEAGACHQFAVALIVFFEELAKIGARQECILEGVRFHVLAPLGSRDELLEHVDVIGSLVGGDSSRQEDAAQHQVLDIET